MRSFFTGVVILVVLGMVWRVGSEVKQDPYAEHIATTGPRSPEEERQAFHLPPGFVAELVAAEPEIHKPLNIAFDDRGRLWVSETVEYPFAAAPGKPPRDAVKILEDFGPDGKARKVSTFADKLNIPIGILPLCGTHPQEALSFSIPNIYRLTADDKTGRVDRREVLYREFGFRDTHGMTNAFTWGFDGWVYACHGYSNTSTVRGREGEAITMQSGNTYRLKPDGSRVEWYTHGQVNPFGLTLDPWGNLYSCDCHSRPIYQLLRGAYYPSFGKPHDGLGFGPEMLSHDHGSTAIAGITYYAADHFPPEYRGTVFVGNVVTNRINHDRLEWHGSSPRAIEQPDFLRSDDPWFRPVDIRLGPDGALYVADFYNRIIGHYEVPLTHPGRDRERGRIWRIVYRGLDGKGTPTAPRADWTRATVGELVQDLAHPNLTVRVKAANQLVERGPKATGDVRTLLDGPRSPGDAGAWQRLHAVWVLERTGGLEERVLAGAAGDPDARVRVQALRVLSERAEIRTDEHKLLLAGLKDPDPNVQRASADALGRHPSPENVRPLLDLRHAVPADDTHLLHVVRMALRDQFRPSATWASLPRSWTEADARAVADVSLGVPSPEAAAFLLEHVRDYSQKAEPLQRFVQHVARYGTRPVGEALLAVVRSHQPQDLGLQADLLGALERGTQERGDKLSEAARAWAVDLTGKLLASSRGEELLAGIEQVGTLHLEDYQDQLARHATGKESLEAVRVAAMKALVALDARRHASILGLVLADASAPIELREKAANLLAGANQPETRAQLIEALPTATARLQNGIAVGLAGSREGAEKLLDSVAAGKASARLLQERAVELRLQEARLPELKARLAKLTAGLPPADQRIQELLARRRQGYLAAPRDAALGLKVFEKHCANCHQIGSKGARIGPQLDGIGIRGLDRLLEDTLDPNRNVDQAFRLTTLTLKNGQVVSGLLLKEEGAVLVLADAQGKEVRVEGKAVDERSVSQMSPMPANFADQIPETDFYHLLAYLLAQQQPRDGK